MNATHRTLQNQEGRNKQKNFWEVKAWEFWVIGYLIIFDCIHNRLLKYHGYFEWLSVGKRGWDIMLCAVQAFLFVGMFRRFHWKNPNQVNENDRNYTDEPSVYGRNATIDGLISLFGIGVVLYRYGWCGDYWGLIYYTGGVFQITAGLASVIGLIITYQSIRELGQNITSFDELAGSIINLAKKISRPKADHVSKKVINPDEIAWEIVAYTPALGYFGLPPHLFEKLKQSFEQPKNGIQRIICLNSIDLKEWHKNFVGVKSRREGKIIQPEDAKTADRIADEILKSFGVDKVGHLKINEMPGFYFFVARDKAIIVSPMHLPLLAIIKEQRIENKRLSEIAKTQAPKSEIQIETQDLEMVGIETSNQHIIEELHSLFKDLWKRYEANPKGISTEKVSAKEPNVTSRIIPERRKPG